MTTFNPHSRKFFTLFTPIYWVAVFAALFLWSRDWAIVRATSTSREQLFGLFGFCVFCVILYIAYTDYRNLSSRPSLRQLIVIGLPILVSLFFLTSVVEHSQKSWDYDNYEESFRAVLNGENPYRSNHSLYPPFFAESMVRVFRFGEWLIPILGMAPETPSLWMVVFYVHQNGLLFALLLSYYLCLRFADKIGLSPLKAMLFVSGLFIFNVPLLRTLIYNQINFYILVSILVAILTLDRHPFLSGLVIALGGLIKLYPFTLAAPLLATRKWKSLLGIIAGTAGIILIQTRFLQDLTLWKQFILFYMSFPVERESSWFRSSSILSFVRNSLEFFGASPKLLTPIFGIVALLTLGWIAFRFLQRERYYRATLPMGNETHRDIGHLIDFSVLPLLIAPSAWEHHYVIAIPLAIWAFALTSARNSRLLTMGLVFTFVMPVFNVFPFSYLRGAGFILLLALTSPNISPK